MQYPENTEATLSERARHDDGLAFSLLFDLHQARIYRRAFGLVSNTHDAEDVAAGAFFELWRKRRTVGLVHGSVLPWLLVTTLNLSRNSLRARARYERVLRTLPRVEAMAPLDEAALETKERLTESASTRVTTARQSILL